MTLKKSVLVTILSLFAFFAISANSQVSANVEWAVKQTLKIGDTPLDVAVSPEWQKLFILTDKGEILIYSASGVLADKITVGSHADQIIVGPQGNTLILRNSKTKEVQIVSLSFIQDIDVSGSPFKGPENAPVVIAVFSDFE
jgi:DNA-binding beta-propeller fold protein YncE